MTHFRGEATPIIPAELADTILANHAAHLRRIEASPVLRDIRELLDGEPNTFNRAEAFLAKRADMRNEGEH